MSDDLKTLVAQEVAKQLATIAADQTTKKVLEFLKNRNSADAYVVETGSEGSDWYRVWSDGFIEQGGRVSRSGTGRGLSVTFLKGFTTTTYSSQATVSSGGADYEYTGALKIRNQTNLGLEIFTGFSEACSVDWVVCGY